MDEVLGRLGCRRPKAEGRLRCRGTNGSAKAKGRLGSRSSNRRPERIVKGRFGGRRSTGTLNRSTSGRSVSGRSVSSQGKRPRRRSCRRLCEPRTRRPNGIPKSRTKRSNFLGRGGWKARARARGWGRHDVGGGSVGHPDRSRAQSRVAESVHTRYPRLFGTKGRTYEWDRSVDRTSFVASAIETVKLVQVEGGVRLAVLSLRSPTDSIELSPDGDIQS